jgi:hypothetical protein
MPAPIELRQIGHVRSHLAMIRTALSTAHQS